MVMKRMVITLAAVLVAFSASAKHSFYGGGRSTPQSGSTSVIGLTLADRF